MAASKSTHQPTPKNPKRTPIWRGGSARTPGGASYRAGPVAAHNPVKRGSARGR